MASSEQVATVGSFVTATIPLYVEGQPKQAIAHCVWAANVFRSLSLSDVERSINDEFRSQKQTTRVRVHGLRFRRISANDDSRCDIVERHGVGVRAVGAPSVWRAYAVVDMTVESNVPQLLAALVLLVAVAIVAVIVAEKTEGVISVWSEGAEGVISAAGESLKTPGGILLAAAVLVAAFAWLK